MKPSTGDGAEDVLFESPEVKVPCDWSPDGRALMYYVPDPTSGTDLWVLPLETRVPSIFLKTDANELWGQFSPDGRWVAYQSNETGRYEIYVRPFSSRGGATPISTAGGVYPRWSRDGKELYYIAPDAKMMAVSIRATATTIEAGVPTTLFQTRRLGGGSNVIGRGHQYRCRSGWPVPHQRRRGVQRSADHAADELEAIDSGRDSLSAGNVLYRLLSARSCVLDPDPSTPFGPGATTA